MSTFIPGPRSDAGVRLRRPAVLWFAVAALILTSIVGGASPPTVDAAGPLRFGTLVQASGGQSLEARLAQLESAIGRSFTDIRIFEQWDDTWPDSFARDVAADGHRIILSVKALRANGSRIQWADVAAARPGSALYATMQRWANAMRDLGTPILFVFDHEPEAVSGGGTQAQYIAAYRNFAGVLESVGATNVENIWIMTANAFKVGSRDRRQAVKWYPGDDVVDVIASDAYNWYRCRGQTEQWRSLETVITPMRNFGRQHPGIPLLLAEFGSAEDPADGGRKAQWYRDARALFKQPGWEQFVGVVHFNRRGQQQCNWQFDSSAAAQQAYVEMAQDPFYGGPGAG